MSKSLVKPLGALILIATIGVASCQALFAERVEAPDSAPPAATKRS
jgi:hypothetical protein